MTFEFVCASHDEVILRENLLKGFPTDKYILNIQRDYTNVAKAYNEINFVGEPDFVVYLHHDLFLSLKFFDDLHSTLQTFSKKDFGVLGCAGVGPGRKAHGFISDRGKPWGSPFNLPHQVETLDELLIVTRGDYIFDENLPQDFYAADVCMQARQAGKINYAINAFCHHNSGRRIGGRTKEYYIAAEYFKNKWRKYLPISTTTGIIQDDEPF